jgi:hypothetical protein
MGKRGRALRRLEIRSDTFLKNIFKAKTMTTIYHHTHPHYKVFKEYIEGCFADPDNPPVVQVKTDDMFDWHDTRPAWNYDTRPAWNIKFEYRLKPRTITRTVTYPEPMRVAPRIGSQVWYVNGEHRCPYGTTWTDENWLKTALKNGVVFSNEADAQACYDALFGEQK